MAVGDDSLDPPGHAPRSRQPSLSPMQTVPPRNGNGATETPRDALTPMHNTADSFPDPRQEAAARTIQQAFRAHRERAAASRTEVESRHEPPPSTKLQEPERPAANSGGSVSKKDFIGFDPEGTFQTPLKIGPFNITARGSVTPGVLEKYGPKELHHPDQLVHKDPAQESQTKEGGGAPKSKTGFGELRVGGYFGGHVLAKMAKRAEARQSRAAAKAKSETDKPSTHTPPSSSAKSGGEKSGR